jgi:hypothetical protein
VFGELSIFDFRLQIEEMTSQAVFGDRYYSRPEYHSQEQARCLFHKECISFFLWGGQESPPIKGLLRMVEHLSY